MKLVIFGASGPTGLELCRQALSAGHQVRATVRRPGEFPLHDQALAVLRADVLDGTSLAPVVAESNAVLSVLGAAYSRHPIHLYSVGTQAIVEAMRTRDRPRRLVVVSAGLAVRSLRDIPKVRGFFQDRIALPLLRNLVGRTLYEDMLRMEDFLATCQDIDWTIVGPGRLIDGEGISDYQLAEGIPVGDVTARQDLAAAMLAELGPDGHVHKKVAPTTR